MNLKDLYRLSQWKSIQYFHPWPFPWENPDYRDILTWGAIIASETESKSGHRILKIPNKYGPNIRLTKARRYVWWLYESPEPENAVDHPTPSCDEPRCIAIKHLVLSNDDRAFIRRPKQAPTASVQLPVAPPTLDRHTCMSAKARFATERDAREYKNKVSVKGHPQYVYPCDLPGCGGWHLTHIKNYKRKVTGSWK